jgi:large subunit ribosomal protein L29
MKAKEQLKQYKNLNEAELNSNLKELKSELFNLRFQMVTGQVENPMRIKEVKRNIARVKTLLREIELGVSK